MRVPRPARLRSRSPASRGTVSIGATQIAIHRNIETICRFVGSGSSALHRLLSTAFELCRDFAHRAIDAHLEDVRSPPLAGFGNRGNTHRSFPRWEMHSELEAQFG